jgi:ABC-2 type transport system ATP-binding protein
MAAIESSGLSKRFDSFTAVENLSFEVVEGEVFGLLGPNGAGKTTTIRMLACLVSPTNGTAKVGGYDIAADPLKVRQSIGVLTENPSLYERLSALENMEFFAQAYGLTSREDRIARIRELLEFFELWPRRNDKVSKFSKGMKQKIAIARALIHRPTIIFLDEPTAGLDPESAKSIRDLIDRLSRQEKNTVLLCTHRLEDADRLCSRMLIINKGRSVVIGTVDELHRRVAGSPILEIALKKLDERTAEAVRGIDQVQEVETDRVRGILRVSIDDYDEITPEVVQRVVEVGGKILSVNVNRPSLEEAYLKLMKEVRE